VQRTLLLIVALVLTGCGGLLNTAAATVNGAKIEEDQFNRELSYLLSDPRLASQLPQGAQGELQRQELARNYLTFLIHQELVQEFADGRGIDVPDEEVDARLGENIAELGGEEAYAEVLRDAGVTELDVHQLIEKQLLREAVATAVAAEQATEEILRQQYEDRILEFSQVHTAHILVGTEQEAERLLQRATPQTFGDLARQFSQDTGSAPNGGDLGVQRASDLLTPFARAALRIEVGEIGGPVQTDLGYHLSYVIDKQTQPFEQAQEQILREIRGQVFTDWLVERVRASEIRVNPRYGYFDEASGQVLERTSTTPLTDEPPVQVQP
jgi:parvulin-like peptidyl-prolyl isomerase